MKREDFGRKGSRSREIDHDIPSVIEVSDISSLDDSSFLLGVGVEMAAAFEAYLERKIAAAEQQTQQDQSKISSNHQTTDKGSNVAMSRTCAQSPVDKRLQAVILNRRGKSAEEEKKSDDETDAKMPAVESNSRFTSRKRAVDDKNGLLDLTAVTDEMKKLRVTESPPRHASIKKASRRTLDSSEDEEDMPAQEQATETRKPMPLALNVDGEFHLFGHIQEDSLAENCERLYQLLKFESSATISCISGNSYVGVDDESSIDEDAVHRFLKKYPETCAVKYNFGGFTGTICPLAMLCALGASLDLVKLAYEACPDAIQESDLWVGSPLHYACSHRPSPRSVLAYLIRKSPDSVKSTNQFGRTPLHMACLFQKDQLDMVQILLEKYPKAGKKKDKDMNTPIHLALDNKASETVLCHLIRACPKAARKANGNLMFPLHRACWNDAPTSVVKLLMEDYPEALTAADDQGQTPLHLACEVLASPALVRSLVLRCPEACSLLNKKGETPLQTAERRKANSKLLEALGQT